MMQRHLAEPFILLQVILLLQQGRPLQLEAAVPMETLLPQTEEESIVTERLRLTAQPISSTTVQLMVVESIVKKQYR